METGNLNKLEVLIVKKSLSQKNYTKNIVKNRLIDISFILQTIILYVAISSLCGIFCTLCSININEKIVYFGLAIMCIWFSGYYYFEKNRLSFFVFILLIQVIIIVIFNDLFKNGVLAIINDVIKQLNSTYSGNIGLLKTLGIGKEYVILCIFFWIVWFTARGMFLLSDSLHFCFIAFPIIIFSILVGEKMPIYMFIAFFVSFQCMIIWSGVALRRKLWGEKGNEKYEENKKISGLIKSKATAFFLSIIIITGIIAYIMSPLLNNGLDNLTDKVSPIKTKGIRFLQGFVPEISNGKLSFTIEGVGGGGNGGILGELSGSYYKKTETLKLTCSELPIQTMYLKGYVGEIYTGSKWLEGDEEKFNTYMSNTDIEYDTSLYIQNLPFLRMMYALNDEEIKLEILPNYITVERYGDVLSYTYVPYQTYLNENYRVIGGDGTVEAQLNYDDTYAYFESDVYEEIITKWNNNDNQSSVLDDIENKYENYVSVYDTKLGDVDLSRLYDLCSDKKEEWDSKIKNDLTSQQIDDLTDEKYEDVKNFIIKTLWENCEFKDEALKLPKGKDYINYFMFDIKMGDSTAFASTAVIMFRMFGIPARYVEGYAAPTYLFSNNGENEYVAVLQDDNAHAWVEIYVSGVGWQCVETTPGFDGSITNMEMPKDDEDNENEDLTKEDENKDIIKDNQNESIWKSFFIWFKSRELKVMIGVILVVLILVIRHLLIKKYRRGELIKLSNNEKIKRIFYSYYDILLFTGFSGKIDTTKDEFLRNLTIWYPNLQDWEIKKYQDIVLRAHFGKDKITDKEVLFSIRMYEKAVVDGKDKLGFIKKFLYNYVKVF